MKTYLSGGVSFIIVVARQRLKTQGQKYNSVSRTYRPKAGRTRMLPSPDHRSWLFTELDFSGSRDRWYPILIVLIFLRIKEESNYCWILRYKSLFPGKCLLSLHWVHWPLWPKQLAKYKVHLSGEGSPWRVGMSVTRLTCLYTVSA